jgi:hypothetical protein
VSRAEPGQSQAIATSALLLVFVALPVGVARVASAETVDDARREVNAQRYREARLILDALVLSGNHPRQELLEIYLLRGEVISVMDGPEAGEQEFRRLLTLDPDHRPPALSTPVLLVPFRRAQRWVAAHGRLAVRCPTTTEMPAPNAEVLLDSLHIVTNMRVSYRRLEASSRTVPGPPFDLPPPTPSAPIDYVIELMDSGGNVVATCGTSAAPLRWSRAIAAVPRPPAPSLSVTAAARPATSRPPLYRRWWLWTGVGVVIAAGVTAGVVLGLSANAPPRLTFSGAPLQ